MVELATQRPVELPELWEHQEEVVERLRQSVKRVGRTILCGQTGFGKSRIAKWVLGSSMNQKPTQGRTGRYLIAVHRRGLVDNLAKNLDEPPGLPYGMMMSGADTAPGERLQLASIDTLLSWYMRENAYEGPLFDFVVFDECHSHLPKFRTFLEAHDRARAEAAKRVAFAIGLSATPRCKGLADVFSDIVIGPSAVWLQEQGFASRYRYMAGTKGDLKKLVVGGDEFTSESVEAAFKGMSGHFIRDWKQHAQGRPTVGFFPLRKYARDAQEQLRAAGIDAEYVDGDTKDDDRRRIYSFLQRGMIDYICNVGVIERGTDIPAISCVQLCTSVGSLVRHRQMIGRGSRCFEGKEDCLILDHGDNLKRNGFFEDEINWTLNRSQDVTREHSDRPPVECPQCHELYRGGLCRKCGYEPERREMENQGLSWDGRPLKEVQREHRKEQRRHPEEIMLKAIMIGGRSGKTFNQAAHIAASIARDMGTDFEVPSHIRFASGKRRKLPWGTLNASKRISEVYPWVTRRKR